MNIFEMVSPTKVDFVDMLSKVLPMIAEELHLDGIPRIVLKKDIDDGEQPTFGHYDHENNIITLAINNRHPIDIVRTLAHEMVHFKQNMDGRITPASGETGSPIENEANLIAGVIMRKINKTHPEFLRSSCISLP